MSELKGFSTDVLKAALIGFQTHMNEMLAKTQEIRRELKRRDVTTHSDWNMTRITPNILENRILREVMDRTTHDPSTKQHRISAEGRARIAAAQNKRWAAVRREKQKKEKEKAGKKTLRKVKKVNGKGKGKGKSAAKGQSV